MIIIYTICLLSLSIYSYALIDPNLTLVNHPLFEQFRNTMVQLGYHNRGISIIVYLTLITFLFVLNYFFTNKYKRINVIKLSLLTGGLLLLSYPFLSHDFFNYLFDAKIVTIYHQNPWTHRALDFPNDSWLRFMHWTHRTYPYGPTWLIISLFPSIISFGKLILNFIFFKALFVSFYLAIVYFINKINKKAAVFFATHPLVIIEGLVSSHNDLIAVALAIAGIYYLSRKDLLARLFFLVSTGIKFITAPLIFIDKNNVKVIIIGISVLIVYVSITGEIQPWYFVNLFIFLPYLLNIIEKFNFFLLGLLVSYYPYIYLGGWDSEDKIIIKHKIIGIFFVLNLFLLLKNKIDLKNYLNLKR